MKFTGSMDSVCGFLLNFYAGIVVT